MAAPPITERHLPHWHRRQPIKEPVRMASTGNLTLSGTQTIDGVVGAVSDRVLVKDNSTGSQNGIWVMASGAWSRAYDVSTDDPGFGYLVRVREGTVNGSTTWANTNTSTPTIGTTALTFAATSSTGTVTSVALTVPAEFSVSGSPVTSSGTLAITKATETANTVWAGPTSGSAAQPAFRALVAADIPAGVGAIHEILISDTPAGSPLVFADLIQNEAQTDLVYSD